MGKKLFNDDIELLNAQANYKNSFIFYILSNTATSLFFKILGAYVLSLLMLSFGLFGSHAFLYVYILIEVVFYNFNDDILKP